MTNGHDFRVLEWKHEKNGSRWVGLPGKPYEKPDGSKSWTPITEFTSKEAKDKFQASAIKAVSECAEVGRQ